MCRANCELDSQKSRRKRLRSTYTLDRARHDLEVRLDVATEDTGLERFDVSSDVRLALEQVAIVHAVVRLDVAVRKDDVRLESFHLQEVHRQSQLVAMLRIIEGRGHAP